MDQPTAIVQETPLELPVNNPPAVRSRVSPRYNRSRRIAWLIEHRQLWQGLLSRRGPGNESLQRRWKEIVLLMQGEGLVQPSTHWSDVNLVSLIGDARKELRASRRLRCSVG
jgi:hypothetical protein